jgi:peptidoglycan/LPS O-acetylase OafA/YrhL
VPSGNLVRVGGDRFTALDSWRGIAACMVVLYHVRVHSHLSDLQLVQHAYLFVDFFFVLSGFVIAASYQERLAGGFGIGRFMLLRFGRVYPLHLAVLAAYLGVELARNPGLAPDASFALLTHLLLIHGIGVFDSQFWNVPSWTISTEFFAYLAFALAVAALGRRVLIVVAAALVLFPVLIYIGHGNMDARGYELMRCLYGFAAGVAAWHLFRRFARSLPAGTWAELVATGAVAVFVSVAGFGPLSIAAPLVFAATVLVFASQRGAASRVLAWKPFLFIGTVSYSIYMVHIFVARRVVEGLAAAKAAGLRAVDYLGVDRWAGDAMILLCLGLVLLVSALTYRFIEVPARAWFRRRSATRELRRPAFLSPGVE